MEFYSNLKVSSLLSICNDQGKLQKRFLSFFVIMCFGHSLMIFSLFYLFYSPEYICINSQNESYSCEKSEACQPNQKFVLDPSKFK